MDATPLWSALMAKAESLDGLVLGTSTLGMQDRGQEGAA